MSAAVTAMMFLSQQAHAGEGEPALGVVYVDMEDWQTPDARLYAEEYPELAEAIEASVADLEESLGRLESVTMFAGFSQVDVYIQGSEQALYVQIAADGVGWAEPWDGESMGDRLALSDTGGLAFPPLSIDLDGLPVFYADSGLDSYAVWILFTSGVGGALGSGGGPIGAGVGAAAGGIIGDAIWSLGGMIADSISSAQASGGKPRDQIGGMRWDEATQEIVPIESATSSQQDELPPELQFGAGGPCGDACFDKSGFAQISWQYYGTSGSECVDLCCESNPTFAGCN